MASIRSNRYYNDPNLGAAFDNLAAAFGPPSAQDIAAYGAADASRASAEKSRAEAQAQRDEALRLSEFFTYARDPNFDQKLFDRRGAALNLWDPSQGYELTTRGQDLASADRRYATDADLQLGREQLVSAPLSEGQTRTIAPTALGPTGLSEMFKEGAMAPAQSGMVKLNPGERAYLPDGRALAGAPKPLSETEAKGAAWQSLATSGGLSDDEIKAVLLADAGQPMLVPGADGKPVYAYRSQAIGKGPAQDEIISAVGRAANGIPPNVTVVRRADGSLSALGGGGTTVNVGGDGSASRKKFGEKRGEAFAGYLAQADVAAGRQQDMTALGELLKVAPQGMIPAAVQRLVPEASTAGTAATAIIKRLVPQMRVEGSGATSDLEFRAMADAMPSLGNSPETNRLIIGVLDMKNQIDLARGEVVNAWDRGEIDDAEASRRLEKLNRQSVLPPELRARIGALGGSRESGGVAPAPAPAAPRPRATNPTTGEVVEYDGQQWVPVR